MASTFTGQQVREAYKNAPVAVRNAFNSPKTTQVVLGLQTKHQLHVDTAGTIGVQLGYLLLGLITPVDFYNGLISNNLAEPIARDIIDTINREVFLPLREQMRLADSSALKEDFENYEEEEAVSSAAPIVEQVPQPPNVVPTIPTPATPPPNLPTGNPPFPSAPAQNPAPQPSYDVAPPMPQQPMPQPYPQYQMPPMQHSTYWVPVSIAHPPQMPMQGYPYQPQGFAAPIPPPQPATPTPPPPSPAEITAPTQPQAPQEAPPVAPTPQSFTPHSSTPIVKQYGSDPYREPIQ